MEDHYKILGVKRDADPDDIKDAYRKLARKFHPDMNPGNKDAEEKFKLLSNAYDVLGDPVKKAAYDQHGFTGASHTQAHYGSRPFTTSAGFSGFGSVNPHDIFEDIFGRGVAKPHIYQNQHINLNYQITLEEAYAGKDAELAFSFKTKNNQKIKLTIPSCIEHGMRIRFAGKGDDSLKGVPVGDLFVTVGIIPHERFKRIDHLTLLVTETISYIDAMLGCIRDVVTIDGTTIQMEVPPNIHPGNMLKVSGKGMREPSGVRGDMLVELKFASPKLTQEQHSILTTIQNEITLKSTSKVF